MAWHDSLVGFLGLRLDDVRQSYDNAISEIASVVAVLDCLGDAQSTKDSEGVAAATTDLTRTLRDFSWSPFYLLEATATPTQKKRLESVKVRLQECLTRLGKESDSEASEEIKDTATVEHLIGLRNELRGFQNASVAGLARWRLICRVTGLAFVIGATLLAAFFCFWGGIGFTQVVALSPSLEYREAGGVHQLTEAGREELLQSMAARLVGKPYMGSSYLKVEEGRSRGRPTQDFEHVWKIELINSSFLRSHFISTVSAEIQLVQPTAFPWGEIIEAFEDPVVEYSERSQRPDAPGTPFGKITNTSVSPVLVSWKLFVSKQLVGSSTAKLLAYQESLPITTDSQQWFWAELDDQGKCRADFFFKPDPVVPPGDNPAPVKAEPGPPSPIPPSAPPEYLPTAERTPEPARKAIRGMSVTQLDSLGLEVIRESATVEIQYTYEGIEAIKKSATKTGKLQLGTIVLRPRQGQIDLGGGAAQKGGLLPAIASAVLDFRGPAGDDALKVDLDVDGAPSESGDPSARRVAVIDRHLSGRGSLTCYVRFMPSTSGDYKLSIHVNGEPIHDFQVAALRLERNPQKLAEIESRYGTYLVEEQQGSMSIEEFRMLQEHAKQMNTAP